MPMHQKIRAAVLRALDAKKAEMTADLLEAIVHEVEKSFTPAVDGPPEKDWTNLMGTERIQSKVKW